jgi:hypothetical protein
MRRLLVLLLLLPLLAGCGGGGVAAVSGRVTLDGRPLANAAVLFQPVSAAGNNNPGPGSTGVTDADGRYTLTITGKEQRGAVVGKHKVRITMMAQTDSPDDKPRPVKQLPPRYNRDTILEYDVPDGGTGAADFALTTAGP